MLRFLLSCSKSGSNTTDNNNSLPKASVNNVTEERASTNFFLKFTVSLDKTSTQDVSIPYVIVDGTAKKNIDYVSPANTVLNIDAGTKTGTVSVEIIGDSLRRSNQEFYIQLNTPVNATISNSKATATLINENNTYLPVDNTGYTTPETYTGYSLTWSDEFSEKEIKSGNWTFESGNNNGWGNNELQYYTDKKNNAFVSDGKLIIEARAESLNGSDYTSARMITKNKKVFTYGRVDIRAKLPKGKGVWPALWMLGNNIDAVSWPACGEIDMMELLGQEPNKVYGTLHWGSNTATHQSKGSNYVLSGASFDQEFHVFSMDWVQDSIKLFIDDQPFFSGKRSDVVGAYPFNNDFFFIFNIAVGGNWPGAPDGSTTFPQRMFVDYIRVFQK